MGLNTLDLNQAAINAAEALVGRPFVGATQAERFCRRAEDDLILVRDAGYFRIERPSETINYIRQPQFGRCGQEDACS